MRDKWQFQFVASQLAEAARTKREHHRERARWWEQEKAKVMDEVRASGIEVSESVAAGYSNATRGLGPQVMVRTDLQTKLSECHGKIMEHTAKCAEYDGWVDVLSANKGVTLELTADDYLYFFGQKF